MLCGPRLPQRTYTAGTSGTFAAARIGSTSDARYRFTGSFSVCNQDFSGCNYHFSGFAVLSMDGANNVSGTAYGLYIGKLSGSRLLTAAISGSVSGATFAGELQRKPNLRDFYERWTHDNCE